MSDAVLVTLRLAWRNIWRNARRTLITGAAIAIGFALLLVAMSFNRGWQVQLADILTESWIGDAQIHAPGYRDDPDVQTVLRDLPGLVEQVRAVPGVRAASPRLLASAVVAIGDRSSGVRMVGVDFEHERQVTVWRLSAGRFPEAPNEALVGYALAETLELDLDAPLVLSTAHAETGDLDSAKLKVVGFMATGDAQLDRAGAVVGLPLAQRVLALPDAAHQIALRVDGPAALTAISAGAPTLDVADWRTLAPLVEKMADLSGLQTGVLVGIIGLILGLGILNTLTMSLVERMREFGVLRALGTTPGRLGALILAEAACLGVVGVALGWVLLLPTHGYLSTTGLSFEGMEFAGVSMSREIRTIMDPGEAVLTTLGVVVVTVLVAGITAWKAGRIRPVDALRHE